MALILALLLSAALVTAADAPTASDAAVTTTAVAVAAAETPKIEPSDGFWEYWGHGKGATRSEIFRNFGLALIAFFGLCFGIWRAWTAHRQAIVAEQGLITDRFSTAVDQLGSNQLPVRLGGIYALWRLTEDAPERDVVRVVDILCAFVRSPPPESSGLRDPGPNNAGTDPEEGASVATTPLRPDVQTILDLIAQESAEYRRVSQKTRSPVFECSASSASAAKPEKHRVPLAVGEGRTTGAPFSFVPFFWASKRKGLAR